MDSKYDIRDPKAETKIADLRKAHAETRRKGRIERELPHLGLQSMPFKKTGNPFLIGAIGLALLLLAYAALLTTRLNRLEARCQRFEADHQELAAKHRALVREVLHVGNASSRQAELQGRTELMRDGLEVPTSTVSGYEPYYNKRNSLSIDPK